jgi:hypothetical protein
MSDSAIEAVWIVGPFYFARLLDGMWRFASVSKGKVEDMVRDATKWSAPYERKSAAVRDEVEHIVTAELSPIWRTKRYGLERRGGPDGCECGAHATSNRNLHSDWCPKFRP